MVACRRVFNLNEIATWFDRLTMSGCAPCNDSRPVWFDKLGTRERIMLINGVHTGVVGDIIAVARVANLIDSQDKQAVRISRRFTCHTEHD